MLRSLGKKDGISGGKWEVTSEVWRKPRLCSVLEVKLRIYIREKNKNMVNPPETDHGS